MTLSRPNEAKPAGGHDVTAEAAQGRNGHKDGHDHASVADHLLSKSLKMSGRS